MMSLRKLKDCNVIVVTDTQISLEDYSKLNHRRFLDFKPILRKERRRLYKFEFRNRWEDAYRSMGA